jgi:hypothetical protein
MRHPKSKLVYTHVAAAILAHRQPRASRRTPWYDRAVRPSTAILAGVAGLIAATLPLPASAYEDQLSLGIGAGYAYSSRTDSSNHGIYANLETSVGFSPEWSLRGLVGFAEHPASPQLSRLTVGIEALYLIDVLEFVPYAGIGLDALASFGVERDQLGLGAHPVVGIDWLFDRSFLLGVSARPIFVLSAFEAEPLYLTVSLTASWLLDL